MTLITVTPFSKQLGAMQVEGRMPFPDLAGTWLIFPVMRMLFTCAYIFMYAIQL